MVHMYVIYIWICAVSIGVGRSGQRSKSSNPFRMDFPTQRCYFAWAWTMVNVRIPRVHVEVFLSLVVAAVCQARLCTVLQQRNFFRLFELFELLEALQVACARSTPRCFVFTGRCNSIPLPLLTACQTWKMQQATLLERACSRSMHFGKM